MSEEESIKPSKGFSANSIVLAAMYPFRHRLSPRFASLSIQNTRMNITVVADVDAEAKGSFRGFLGEVPF